MPSKVVGGSCHITAQRLSTHPVFSGVDDGCNACGRSQKKRNRRLPVPVRRIPIGDGTTDKSNDIVTHLVPRTNGLMAAGYGTLCRLKGLGSWRSNGGRVSTAQSQR